MRPYLHRWSLLAALALGAVVALAATVPPPAPPKAAATTPKAAPKAKPGVPTPPKSTTPAAPRPALGPPVPLAPTCPVNPLRRHSGHPATKDAIAQWVQQLAAPELVTGWKAAEELVLAGKDATPPLLEVMAGKNIQARRDAAWALGLIRDVSAVPALLDAIQNDGDLSVRTEAVWALGEISDPKAAPALAGQLKVADPAAYYDEMNPGLRPVADVAQEALTKIGPAAVEAILPLAKDAVPGVRLRAVHLLSLPTLQSSRGTLALNDAMADQDVTVRRAAVDGLNTMKDASSLPALQTGLKDTDPQVREHAAMALGRIGKEEATDSLTAALTDPEQRVRVATVEALSEIGQLSALKPLLTALTDKVPEVRASAARSLQILTTRHNNMKDLAAAIDPCIAALKDTDATVRASAAMVLGALHNPTALGASHTPAAVDALVADLNDPDRMVQSHVLSALGTIKDPRAVPPLLALMQSKGKDVEFEFLAPLVQFNDARVVAPLLAVLKLQMPKVEPYARYLLGQLTPETANASLLAALKSSDATMRYLAMLGLSGHPTAAPFDTVKAALHDPDSRVMAAAAETLAASKNPAAVPALIPLAKSKDKQRQQLGYGALVALGKPGLAAIIQFWKDKDPRLDQQVWNVLMREDQLPAPVKTGTTVDAPLPGALALEALHEAMSDPAPAVRMRVTALLGAERHATSLPYLTHALKDKDPEVRAWAVSALAGYDTPAAVTALKGALTDFTPFQDQGANITVACVAAAAMHGTKEKDYAPLVAAIKSKDDERRTHVAQALGWSGDPAVAPTLLTALSHDATFSVRRESALALAQIHAPGAVAPLIAALKDSNEQVRSAAAMALGSFNNAAAITPLLPLLQDKKPIVRLWAAWALGKLKAKAAVKPLVAMLSEKGLPPPIIGNVLAALTEITGKHYGGNLTKWQAYAQAMK